MNDLVFRKEIVTEVNGDICVTVNRSANFFEIWQDDDLVECEVERLPALIKALQEAHVIITASKETA